MTKAATTPAPTLPAWAEELKERYLRGESSQFVVHGNVHDLVLWGGKLLGVAEFLSQELFSKSKEAVLLYNVSTGIRFTKQSAATQGHHEEFALAREPAKALPVIERMLATSDRLAVILEYAETIAPAGETSFSTLEDRAAVVTLHRWSLLRSPRPSNLIMVAFIENLAACTHPHVQSRSRPFVSQCPTPTNENRPSSSPIPHSQKTRSRAFPTRRPGSKHSKSRPW